MQVADAFSQDLPTQCSLRIAFTGAKDSELMRSVQRGFHTQDTALFIIKFARVAVGLVFEAQAFRSLFELAQDLSLEITMHMARGRRRLTEETQHVGAAKVADAMVDQRGVESGQSRRAFEHDIGGLFAFIDAPVIGQSQRTAEFRGQGMALIQQRLQPQVHKTEDLVLLVKVVMQTLARPQSQNQFLLLTIPTHKVGQARLHATPDPDQTSC